jgi:NAD(P)-dependent dehydrogenase (short-subunit alcohol dehydrogenase family)
VNDKICLVTGDQLGIGFEIRKGLAERGATVVMVSRNARKGEDVMARGAAGDRQRPHRAAARRVGLLLRQARRAHPSGRRPR